MRVLAIDTALGACAAAVLDSQAGAILASESLGMVRGHAEAVMPLIARVMDAARCEFAELDRIAVTVGPGSFTGLRVGISAARGIALAAGRPAIGLSTLSALAAPHVAARSGDTIIAAIDARNEQVYFQVFAPNGVTIVTPRLDRVRAAVRAVPVGPTVITGSGAMLVAAHWPSGSPVPRVEDHAAPGHRLGRAPRRRRAGGGRRRRSRSICAGPMRVRRTPAGCRADEGLVCPPVRPRRAGARRGASARRRGARRAACGLVQSRLERARIRAIAHRPQRDRGPRRERAQDDRLHRVAPRRRRGRDPLGRGRARLARARARRAACSTCICAALRASACAPCSSKSTRTTSRRAGSMPAPGFARSGAGRATIRRGAPPRPRWCCGATLSRSSR